MSQVENEKKSRGATLRLPKLSPLYADNTVMQSESSSPAAIRECRDRGGGSGFPSISSENSRNDISTSNSNSPSGGGSVHRYQHQHQHQQSNLKQQTGGPTHDGTSSSGVAFRNGVTGSDEGGAGFGIVRSILDQQQGQQDSSPGNASNALGSPAAATGTNQSATSACAGDAGDVSSSANSGNSAQPQHQHQGSNAQPAAGAMRLADQLRSFDALRGDLNDRLRHRLENMRSGREESYKAKFNAFHVQVAGCGAHDFNGNRWRRDAEDSKRVARERIVDSHPWFGKLCATAGYERGKVGPEMQVVGKVRTVIEKTGDFQQHDFRVLVESLPPESIARTGVQKIVSFIRDGLRIGFKDRSNPLPGLLKKRSAAAQQSQAAQEKLAKLSPRLPHL